MGPPIAVLGCFSALLISAAATSWMYLGMSSLSLSTSPQCAQVPFLVTQQVAFCQDSPETVGLIARGARAAMYECHRQFVGERWDCNASDRNVLDKMLDRATRETGYIYAISSAGVVHAVARGCSQGNLTECTCARMTGPVSDQWKWGGCSDNVRHGIFVSKKFVDAPETVKHQDSRDVRNLINLQNNRVGREAIRGQMELSCRCHGVSGSCELKTCWKRLPTLAQVGAFLKQRYRQSVVVSPRSRRKLKRRNKRHQPILKNELVFLEQSPDYCVPNRTRGIFGTRGRMCNRTSNAEDSCGVVCCGRGYNTQVVQKRETCDCKFVWCCEVQCKTCERVIDIHTCK